MGIRLIYGRTKHYTPRAMILRYHNQIWIRIDLPKLHLTIMLGAYEK